jgi:hypothetical protein
MAQDDAFKQGLQARGDRKWADVVRHMQNAVKADAQESRRRVRSGFLGVQGMEYLPHYFMGEAYFNLQDCGGAVTEWSISEQHGAVPVRPEFLGLMRTGFKVCASKGVLLPAEYNPLYNSARQAYMEATALGKRISDLGATHREAWRPEVDDQYARAKKELENAFSRLTNGQRTRLANDFSESRAASERASSILRPLEATMNAAVETITSLQKQTKDIEQILAGADTADQAIDAIKTTLTDTLQATRKSGRQQLTQARDRLAVAQKTQNPAAVTDALKYAQSGSAAITQVLEQAQKLARGVFEQQFADAIKSAEQGFERLTGAMRILDRRVAQRPELAGPTLTSDRAAVEKQVDALRRRFDRARKAEDLASLTETARLTLEAQSNLDGLIKAFGPITLRDRGVTAALEDGVRLYLSGDYQKALSALEPLAGQTTGPLQVHAHVFRAAALYALFVRSGETNQELRTQALAEIARSKQLDATFQPNTRVFAPRFLTLYQSSGS